MAARRKMRPERRFWEKVSVGHEGGCWLWTDHVNNGGYGVFWFNRRHVVAHRFSYEINVGPIPEGLVIDHLCRVRNCVNPEHMEPVTQQVNVLRGDAPAARQAKRTHCIRGHVFDEENTYFAPSAPGKRQCRTCIRHRTAGALEEWSA